MGMILVPSILPYMPPSVELLGPITPFQTWTHDPQFSYQIDASRLVHNSHLVKNNNRHNGPAAKAAETENVNN